MHRDALEQSRAHAAEMATLRARLDDSTEEDAEDTAAGRTAAETLETPPSSPRAASADEKDARASPRRFSGRAARAKRELLAKLEETSASAPRMKTPSPEKRVKRLQAELDAVRETVSALREATETKPTSETAASAALAALLESASQRETTLRAELNAANARVALLERELGESRAAFTAARAPAAPEPNGASATTAAAPSALAAALAGLRPSRRRRARETRRGGIRAAAAAIDAAAATSAAEAAVKAHADAQAETAAREARLEARLATAESRAAELASALESARRVAGAAADARRDLESSLETARRRAVDGGARRVLGDGAEGG